MQVHGTDEWWISRLCQKIASRRSRVELLGQWMDGEPPIPAPDNDKPGFERLQQIARINVADLIVESRVHRMQLRGAATRLDRSANGDDVVAGLMEAEDLQRKFAEVFRMALGKGLAYVSVLPGGKVRVSGALNTAVEYGPDGEVAAALSVHRNAAADRDVMILARPGYYRYAYHDGASLLPGGGPLGFFPAHAWELQPPVASTARVPVHEFAPVDGKSLIEKHLPTMERINHGVLQRLILIAIQAFRQRGLKNAPMEDEDGVEIDYNGVFESSPDAFWILPEGTDIWESGQADISPVLNAVKDDLRFLAVESKTPLYMISPDDANGSAEGASTQRETLIFDVEAQINAMQGKVKRVLSDMLEMTGETERADPAGIKLLWANPRRSSIQERANAALAAKNAGIPFRMALEKFAELDPDDVEEALEQRSEDTFLQSVVEAAEFAAG